MFSVHYLNFFFQFPLRYHLFLQESPVAACMLVQSKGFAFLKLLETPKCYLIAELMKPKRKRYIPRLQFVSVS